jgi:hypothetical protein
MLGGPKPKKRNSRLSHAQGTLARRCEHIRVYITVQIHLCGVWIRKRRPSCSSNDRSPSTFSSESESEEQPGPAAPEADGDEQVA